MRPDPRTGANFCVVRELLSPAGMQWDPCYPVLFRRKCAGHVFASAVLLPPRNGILEASQTHVCSLMHTLGIRSATLRLQELAKMFKRKQQIRFPEFKFQRRK